MPCRVLRTLDIISPNPFAVLDGRQGSPARPASSTETHDDTQSIVLRFEANFNKFKADVEKERAAWNTERTKLVSTVDRLGNEVSNLKTRLEAVDRARRATNVVIFGLTESLGDSVKQVPPDSDGC
jgi:hypothetical protein